MLCNREKTEPPTQEIKYCGFYYRTTGIPMLIIPPEKRNRSKSMIAYLLSHKDSDISALGLAVVVGTLQSLVEATPSRLGQTNLRQLHDVIHEDASLGAKEKYYWKVRLSPGGIAELHWWNELLQPELCRPARPMRADVLGVTWGDGSGTGTGATVDLLGFTAQRMWMGTWGPLSRQNTSNWKELETLQITLSRAVAEYRRTSFSPFLNCTLFYFTDNTVTYNCVTSGSS